MNRTSNQIAISSAIALLAITNIVLPELGLADDKSAKAPDSTTAQPTERFSAEQMTFFEAKIRPILINRCGKCHLNGTAKGSLALDDRQSLLKGGDNGPAITLNDLKASLILNAINYDTMEMPPSGKLPKPEIELLTKWVNDRAPMPNESLTKNKAGESKSAHAGPPSIEEGRKYWAYRPIVRPAVPTSSKLAGWNNHPIDAFLAARLEKENLTPNSETDKRTLLRRITYDLTGLPPTLAELDAFLADDKPDAFERVVDRLLASPHYGERWGRHWLDVVRYAETNGYERDGPKPNAWRFRDYVIDSFNQDKPYDQFVTEQLAGDEFPNPSREAIIATGFHRLGVWDDEPADPKQAEFDGFDDLVATTSQAFLGMTMNCARCHDHKVDPIKQSDYYRLLAFFRNIPPFSDTRDVVSKLSSIDITSADKKAQYEPELLKRQQRIQELIAEMTAMENAAIAKMPSLDQEAARTNDREQVIRTQLNNYLSKEERTKYQRLKQQIVQIEKRPLPTQEFALGVGRRLDPVPDTHLMVRGSPHSPGKKVSPGFPEVLLPSSGASGADASSTEEVNLNQGRRLALARWITSTSNPLTARVMVNRIWQHHFGKGLVGSSNDFGKLGELPTHPELLDWLAREFMEPTWSPSHDKKSLDKPWTIKRLHRLLVTSKAYRLSSVATSGQLAKDPSNKYLWRFNPRRLSAEEVRDSLLALTGSLNLAIGGPSVYPAMPKEVLASQSVPGKGWTTSPESEANRRSVYVHVKRSLAYPILTLHDQAEPDSSCPVRYTTTVPTQALNLLNSELSQVQAAKLRDRLLKDGKNDVERIQLAIRLSTGRTPSESEIASDRSFINRLIEQGQPADQAWRLYCLMIINTNEFIYLD